MKGALLVALLLAAPRIQEDAVPVVFNHTRSARPGDLVSLQGEHFGGDPEVKLDGVGRLPIVNSVGTIWAAVRIPAEARGALSLRVKNGSPVCLNRAWPLHLDALQLAPGGAFRVFGRNLRLPGSTPTVTVDGKPAALRLDECDESMLVATAPVELAATAKAAILVDNGNGSGPVPLDRQIEVVATAPADPFGLAVGWTAAFAPLTERVTRVPAGADAEAIQKAIDESAPRGGTVELEAGTYPIAKTLTLRSKVVLQGAGKEKTVLRYEKSNYPVWASRFDLVGVRSLTIANGAAGEVEGPLLKGNTRVVLENVRFDLGVSQQLYLSHNRNIVVRGCDFVQQGTVRGQGPYQFSGSAGLVFTRNTTHWKYGAPSFQESHDSLLLGNTWTRDASVQNTPVVTTHSCVIDFCHRIAVVGNTFDIVNGPVTNRERNDGETLLTEGGGGHRTENVGTVGSATPLTLTDPANTLDVDPFGEKSIPENYGVAIVAGKGAGQTRRVTAYAEKTLTVDRAWDSVPDATSRYATFVWGLEKSILMGNTLRGNPRGIWLYHTAIREVEVLGNTIEEGGGIYLRTWQSVGDRQFTPHYGVRIAGNRISNTTGIWASHVGAVVVLKEPRPFGIGQIGVEVRDNRVTANEKNVTLNLEDYASSEGYYALLKPEIGKYEGGPFPPFLGMIFERNLSVNAEAAFRLGTGHAGAILSGNRAEKAKEVLVDPPALPGLPASQGTKRLD